MPTMRHCAGTGFYCCVPSERFLPPSRISPSLKDDPAMLDIYIDADACPVKDEILRVAERHDLQVFVVSNSWMRNMTGEKVQRIVVDDKADAADDWIAEHISASDIVITADILLAGRAI